MTAEAHPELAQLRAEAGTSKVTGSGVLLFCIGALFFGSAFKATRIAIGPMYVHPALLLIVPALFALLPKIDQLRTKIVPSAALFMVAFASSAIFYPAFSPWVSEFIKIGAMFGCVIVGALLPKTVADIQAATFGMAAAACVMAVRVLTDTGTTIGGTTFIEMGNKNQYSMFALPPLLLMGYFVLGYRGSKSLKIVYSGAIAVLFSAILLSGNRSGWAAAAFALAALYALSGAGLKLRGWLFAGIAALGVYYMIGSMGADVVEERIELTQSGYASDEKRIDLLTESLRLGMENPILGTGPMRLEVALTKRIPQAGGSRAISPHNMTAFVVGGLGLFGTGALLWFFSALWSTPKPRVAGERFVMSPTAFVRLALVLFLVRGQFTEAILWSLPFGLLLGLAVALARVADVGAENERSAQTG